MNIPIPKEWIIGIIVLVVVIIIICINTYINAEEAARIKRISDSFRQIKLKCSVEARTKHGGSTNFELALIETLLSLGATVVLAKDSDAKDVVQILATVTEIVTEKTSNKHKVLSTTSYEARTTNPSPEISPYYPTLKVEYSSVYEVEIRVISADGNNIITVHNGSYVYGPNKVIYDLLEKIIIRVPQKEDAPTSEQK